MENFKTREKNKINRRNLLIIAALIYTGIFVIFYPSFQTYADESLYLHGTWLLKEGKSQKVINPLESLVYLKHGDGFVSTYPIGVPLILQPFGMIGWKYLFLSGLILHLIGFFIFIKILKRLEYDELFSTLYLFFPGFVFFSRTVMSEIPSIVAILAGFYFYLGYRKRDNLAAGLLFGAACLFRYTNLLAFIPFLIITSIRAIKEKLERDKLVLMCAGFMPFALFILWYNSVIYGGVFASGMSSPRPNLELMITIFIKFFITTIVMYPLMLIAPFRYKNKAGNEILFAIFLFMLAFSYSGVDTFHYDFAKNMIIGGRYLFPIVPLMMIAYVPFFMDICGFFKVKYKAALYLFVIFLIIGSAGISFKQYQFTTDSKQISDAIYSNTEPNSLLFGNGYTLSFLNNLISERKGVSIKTHHTPDGIDINYSDESRGLNYIYGNYRNHTTYLIFLAQQSVQDFRLENEFLLIEQGKKELLERFNYSLVYEQQSPNMIEIYRIY